MASPLARALNGLLMYDPPVAHQPAEDKVVVATIHFGETVFGLTHNYAVQRLRPGCVTHSCYWVLEANDKGPDGQHTIGL